MARKRHLRGAPTKTPSRHERVRNQQQTAKSRKQQRQRDEPWWVRQRSPSK